MSRAGLGTWLGLVCAAIGELGRQGLRVNLVSLGRVATLLSCVVLGMGTKEMEALMETHDMLRAVDVVEALLFLASDQIGFISGHNPGVDGATTAINHAMLRFPIRL